MLHRLRHEDDGLTLIELLAAMLVMLILTVPLVTSFVLGLTTTRDGLQDTTNSADAQALAAFFDVDVANSQAVQAGTPSGCGGPVLTLTWDDAGTVNTVVYRMAAADVDVQQDVHEVEPTLTVCSLERLHTVGSGTPEVTTVARSVVGTPAVSCGDSACGTTPRSVSLEVVLFSALVRDKDLVDGDVASNRFTMGVTAERKVTVQ